MKNRYKISELAKIADISKQTLIFYHKKGILIPEYIDENNGYRFYSNSQIWDLFFIITLKEAGFSLEEIKEYTKVKTPLKSLEFLEEKVDDIDKKIEELKKSRDTIQEKILCIKEMSSNLEEKVQLVELKAMKVYFIKIKDPVDEKEIAETYDKLQRLGNKNGIKEILYITKVKQKDIYENSEIPISEIGLLVPEEYSILGEEFIENKYCVMLRHKTTFDMIKLTYENLHRFIKENNFEVVGDSIEIGNEVVVPLENGFGGIIDIYIPVKKIEKF
ncbi:MAG: MerR family transcriptional regulator [Cetobacterium sp.]|uniref:MerR family transcriptional regulator n=1 Tax=Cetobacterium sp. ZOR0034 TaxID=1339239 RepID=UPI00068CB472|nr:MerR family transcriptional regulator [Cetobacterium sp. ZOR0034]